MAESKGALIAKSVQKHAGRAKEKLLQNLGKVDRTLDDIFEEHLQNFNRQHQQATRLQKEFNNYIRCIRAVQTASKSLMEAITEVYESGWSGHDLLYVQAQNMEMLWQDFSHKLGDQVLIPLNTYTNQFPEVRKKVEKRGRKLVDYDSQRHSFQNLQANAAKRRDDVKVTKGREQLEEAKRTYEVLNSELHDELPALYDSRVLFYVHNLQTLFAAEQLFHNESSKVFAELEAITDKLANECQRGSYTKRANNALPAPPLPHQNGNSAPSPTNTVQTPSMDRATPPSPGWLPPATPPDDGPLSTPDGPPSTPDRPLSTSDRPLSTPDRPLSTPDRPLPTPDGPLSTPDRPLSTSDRPLSTPDRPLSTPDRPLPTPDGPLSTSTPGDKVPRPQTPVTNGAPPPPARREQDKTLDNGKEQLYDVPVGSPEPAEKLNNNREEKQVDVEKKQTETENKPKENQNKTDEVYDIPVGATLAGLPAGTLYRVRATYRYTREDSDELSFDVGDLIRVVEYDDPDEQEEGWLMGIKESTNEKGMFPANFTRPI